MKKPMQRVVVLYTDSSSRLIKGDADDKVYGETALTSLLNEGWVISQMAGLGDGTAAFVLELES